MIEYVNTQMRDNLFYRDFEIFLANSMDKKAVEANKRWNVKNLKDNLFEFYYGDEKYTEEIGCVSCYQYDPVEYRKTVVIKVSQMATKEG